MYVGSLAYGTVGGALLSFIYLALGSGANNPKNVKELALGDALDAKTS